jgi:quercetin dioxygenase-like cupin family protein
MSGMNRGDSNVWDSVGRPDLGIAQRLLWETPGGTVKIVRMAAGGGFPLHHHVDRDEWVFVLAGQLETEVDDVIQVLPPGGFRAMPVGSRHRLGAPTGPVEVLVGAFRPAGVRRS